MTVSPASTLRSDPREEAFYNEGLAVKSAEEVADAVDPRIRPEDIPDDEEVDESLSRQLSELVHHRDHHHHHGDIEKHAPEEAEHIYVDFEKGDPRNPINFSRTRKWVLTLCACFFTGLSAAAASTYNTGFPSMMRDLNCTTFQASIGLSVYALGFGIIPLVTASFSEEFGRQPLYIGSAIGFALMHLMVALSKNIQTVIVARLLAGAFGSTGATMVGGTIADIWLPYERGLPMSFFAVAAIGASGLGPAASGWIEMNHRLGWRWIQWVHLIITGIYVVMIPILMKETRSAVLLTRLARKLRKETGNHRYRARAEDERGSLRTLILISCTRPLHLLITEPAVFSFSLWIGFAWGIFYGMIESISPIFKTLHHFNSGQVGLIFLTMPIGTLLGFLTNVYQERLYQKYVSQRGPEARLYCACAAAVLFPVGLFIYAWSSFSFVYWIGLAIGIVVFMWALFIMYLAVFSYLADCYGPFASSALAGQSLCRNLMGMAFPLFSQQMYARLTYKWSSTLLALIAVLMIPIPLILFLYGPAIRRRSKFASRVM
ncbi:MFS polyamine transporter [Gloeophyllum trabeum ATCC 11539]|uniref:MFS polyamine transporter n=1 Tax=Gloeophyllum trabeum (strain ATCC 11539 / FP-39264 / Madison 617) TaxID=670483 RepID=S7QBE8_GLOTA|nr:MFS polyamine transporter [Gloeophyllum trabeum ATCC 11539]EPQ56672.1 MFS polyamine transporter [Gloeophyllum trabeum ATCC 11539]